MDFSIMGGMMKTLLKPKLIMTAISGLMESLKKKQEETGRQYLLTAKLGAIKPQIRVYDNQPGQPLVLLEELDITDPEVIAQFMAHVG